NQGTADILPWLPEREALRFVASRQPIESVLFSGLVQSPKKQRADWLAACWDWALGRRALVLDELAARHRDAMKDESPEVEEGWRRLVEGRRRLAELSIQAMSGADPSRLTEATRAKDDAERALLRVSASYREEQHVRLAPLADVSAALPPGSALVEYVRT